MTIEEIEQEIIDEFSIYDDWMDKYAYLIELGSGLEGTFIRLLQSVQQPENYVFQIPYGIYQPQYTLKCMFHICKNSRLQCLIRQDFADV